MAKPKFKINLFDAIIAIVIILVIIVVGFAWNNQPYLGSNDMTVIVRVDDSDFVRNITGAQPTSGQVCIDSYRYCGQQTKAQLLTDSASNAKYLQIVISGVGDISKDKSIFMGHRVLINQLVQLRGNYVADGRITDFYYEN